MPTYKNNTNVTLYVPEEVKAGATRSFTRYKYGTALTLLDENPLGMVLASGTQTLASAATISVEMNTKTNVDMSIVCSTGELEFRFNDVSHAPVRLTKGLIYNNTINTELMKKVYIKATAPDTLVYYSFVRV